MRPLLALCTILLGLAGAAHAQPVTCRDGTVLTGPKAQVMCRLHGGLPLGAPVEPPRAAAPAAPPAATATPGGGGGQVWVNTRSHVYHCPGAQYYGKTRQGSYMSETEAKASGARPAYGHACS